MIELKSITFKYKKSLPEVFKDINLIISPGEKVLIAGKNGAGKTTLSKIISGLIPRVEHGVLSGSCSINNKKTSDMAAKELAGSVAVLFQDFEAQITATSVREELIFYPMNIGIPYEKALAGAEELAARFGMSALLSRDISELSGGEKQKIEIMSLLNANPKIIVLDEPFTDIDPASQEFILEFLKSDRFKGTLVVFEQSLKYYESFDRVILLEAGGVVRDGGRDVCADFQALQRAGLDAPAVYRICGGYPGPQYSIVDLLMETKAFYRDIYQKLLVEPVGSNKVVFDVKNLSFSYPGMQEHALGDVSFTINEGDFLSVVGPNGSGKTTLMKILAGILRFKKGRIFYRMSSLKTHSTFGKVGYVYQNPDNQIFAETVFDEIAFALRTRRAQEKDVTAKVESMMDMFNITGKRSEDPFSLPKGDRQKIACASILVFSPDVIILDEPTTGLDAQSLHALMKIMTDLNKAGKIVVIITHCMEAAARYGNRIMAMNEGRVVYYGNKRGFFGNESILKEANAKRTEIMDLSLKLNGDMLLNEEEFEACWKDR